MTRVGLAVLSAFVATGAAAQNFGLHDARYTSAMFLRDGAVTVAVLAVAAGSVALAHRLLRRRFADQPAAQPLRWALLAAFALFTIVMLVVWLPFTDENRRALMTLLGYVVSAIVALASATVAANLVAGFLLRSVWKLQVGDYLRLGDQFGEITQIDAMRLRVAREDGGTVIYPASHLITHPFEHHERARVLVSVELSLGFDVAHTRATPLLLAAAAAAGLVEPRLRLLEIGDHAIRYRVGGLLGGGEPLFAARSALIARLLDTLHGEDLEIASPTLISNRDYDPATRFRPAVEAS